MRIPPDVFELFLKGGLWILDCNLSVIFDMYKRKTLQVRLRRELPEMMQLDRFVSGNS